MPDAYQLEQNLDRYLLEDATGVYLLEQQATTEVFFENYHPIEEGMKAQTAAGMGGVLSE